MRLPSARRRRRRHRRRRRRRLWARAAGGATLTWWSSAASSRPAVRLPLLRQREQVEQRARVLRRRGGSRLRGSSLDVHAVGGDVKGALTLRAVVPRRVRRALEPLGGAERALDLRRSCAKVGRACESIGRAFFEIWQGGAPSEPWRACDRRAIANNATRRVRRRIFGWITLAFRGDLPRVPCVGHRNGDCRTLLPTALNPPSLSRRAVGLGAGAAALTSLSRAAQATESWQPAVKIDDVANLKMPSIGFKRIGDAPAAPQKPMNGPGPEAAANRLLLKLRNGGRGPRRRAEGDGVVHDLRRRSGP